MNIKETALKVWDSNMIECPPENLTKFAEALVAELANENKPVYAFRRKGLDYFCTCDERRYKELAQKPTLFEVKALYTLPPTAEQIEQEKRDAEQWRAYQKRKQDLLDRGFLRSPLREEAELNPAMAQGEK